MRDRSSWLLVALMCLGFMASACSTNDAPVFPDVALVGQDGAYRLGEGDRLLIAVFGQEDLSGEFEIDGRGQIVFPLVGDLLVADRSPDDIELMIVSALQPEHLKNPVVSVEVVEHRDFYILGNVPDPYPLRGGVIHPVLRWCGPAYRPNESVSPNWLLSHEGRCRTRYTYRLGEVIERPEWFY